LNGAVVRIDAGKLNVLAKVISSLIAQEAVLTWNTRLDSHPVAWCIYINNRRFLVTRKKTYQS
jgi:hypothetical protein